MSQRADGAQIEPAAQRSREIVWSQRVEPILDEAVVLHPHVQHREVEVVRLSRGEVAEGSRRILRGMPRGGSARDPSVLVGHARRCERRIGSDDDIAVAREILGDHGVGVATNARR